MAIVSLAACGGPGRNVPGTNIKYSDANKSALDRCEEYRTAVERGDADALMLMAHAQYWEDSGTPSGGDDYGYEGLRNVLTTRLTKASDIRYSVRYLAVHQSCPDELQNGCKAAVDIMIDASFTVTSAMGQPKRPDKRDQNQLVLQWTCGTPKVAEPGAPAGGGASDGGPCRWLFISGM
ncbi:MAG TPA: hypothetical protein VIV11_21430 [Kofleriaceae bacterium]